MGIKTGSPHSESMTFRLESGSLKKLKAKAKEERISLNTLINQVVSGYAEWDITATSAGWMVMPKIEVKHMLECLTDAEIEKISKESSDYTRDIRLLMTDRDDLEGFLSMVKLRSKRSGFAYKEVVTDSDIRVTVQHDLGLKWSLRTKYIYQNILYEMGKKSKVTVTPNTIVCVIEL